VGLLNFVLGLAMPSANDMLGNGGLGSRVGSSPFSLGSDPFAGKRRGFMDGILTGLREPRNDQPRNPDVYHAPRSGLQQASAQAPAPGGGDAELMARLHLDPNNPATPGLLAQARKNTADGGQAAPDINSPGAQMAMGLREHGFGPAPAPANPGPFTPAGVTAAPSKDLIRQSIKDIESSGGNYTAVGNRTRSGDRAYGAYQVMGNNIGPWTQQVLGRRLSPQEFLHNPHAQDAVFDVVFGEAVKKYGLAGAANTWFTGSPIPSGKKDVNGMADHTYVARFLHGLGMPVRDAMNPNVENRPSEAGVSTGSGANGWMTPNPAVPLAQDEGRRGGGSGGGGVQMSDEQMAQTVEALKSMSFSERLALLRQFMKLGGFTDDQIV
jgi:hypothetical protein